MARDLKLKHVVVTSVTRDDLTDGGAGQFAEVVRWIRKLLPAATVELLTPDFRGSREAADTIIAAAPDVFNHNVETVPGLYREIRPGAVYERSLELLRYVAERSGIVTKSGLMVGLGETFEELGVLFEDLAAAQVRILTIGQYLAPSNKHHPVHRYISPDEFEQLRRAALKAGLRQVLAAPLVRSSYRADEFRRI
jgi:lipoic acid synthetase